MRVATSLLGTVAIPVFHHRIDALRAPSLGLGCGLEGIAIGTGHVGGQLRILAKGTAEAEPTRVGGDVDLWRQGCGDAQGTVFLGGDLSEAVHQLGIERGSKAEGGRPEGYLTASPCIELSGGIRLMTGVGTGVGGDAVVKTFDKGLHVVVPLCGDGRTLHLGDQDGPQVVVLQEFLLVGCQVLVGHRLMAAIEHQTCDFLEGEFRGQVGSTLLGREAPVLIGIQGVVTVQVLEGVAVDRQDLHSRLW